MKDYIKCLCVALAGALLFVVGRYLWFSPLFMGEGVIVFTTSIIVGIICFVHRGSNTEEKFWSLSVCSAFLFLVLGFFSWISSDSFVSECGDDRHIYADCPQMKGTEPLKLSYWNALFMGCFCDCKVCEKREEEEQTAAEIKRKLEDIQYQIDVLQEVKAKLENGEDVNIQYYEFVGDYEDDSGEPWGRMHP